MVSFVIKTDADREMLALNIASRSLPFTVDIAKGKRRTVKQNSLQFRWLTDASQQLGETVEELRGYCKLHFGVPILRTEDPEFCEAYDRVFRKLSPEQQLAAMMIPLDLPVTRRFTTSQETRYLDAIARYFAFRGVRLTEPERMMA